MKKDRTPVGFCLVGANMRTPNPRAFGSLSHRVIAPLAGAGMESIKLLVSFSAMPPRVSDSSAHLMCLALRNHAGVCGLLQTHSLDFRGLFTDFLNLSSVQDLG